MSLEELLKTPESPSLWKRQRKKLLGVLAAILVVVFIGTFVSGALLVPRRARLNEAAQVDPDTKVLAQLMRVQKDTDQLRQDVLDHARSERRASYGAAPARGRRSATRIVNYDPGEGFTSLKPKNSEIYIPTGAVFQATLVTPIKTSMQRTFVMAETTHEYRFQSDSKRKIPQGARLTGRSAFDPTLKGVTVEFETIAYPNGEEHSISSLALSRNALPELEGIYFSNKAVTYGTALSFGFLSGFADAAREREGTPFGSQPTVNLSNQLLSGLATSSFQVADEMIRDIQNSAIEYVVIPAGEQIFVVLTQKYSIDGSEK